MISFQEICKEPLVGLSEDNLCNLFTLYHRINTIRRIYDQPMLITSGFRTMKDHLRIYNQKNTERELKGFPDLRVPLDSCHLIGAAADVADPKSELKSFIADRVDLLESVGLWCENFDATPGWVHFQIYPPKSEKRFFIP